MREKFLVTDQVPNAFLAGLSDLDFECIPIAEISNEDLAKSIDQYSGIVVNTRILLNEEMLNKAVRLKYILRPGSGLDNIDIAAAKKRNILVLNSPEANKDAVAEHAVGLLINLLRFIPKSFAEIKEGKWVRKENTGNALAGKIVGIIGYGNTGSAFAEKLKGFGVEILVYDKYLHGFGNEYVQEVDLETLKSKADIVSLHIPLTEFTNKMVNEAFIESFSKPFYFINTSRGAIVSQSAILRGLESGKLKGAALDVLENENFGNYSQAERAEFEKLLNSGNILITPHIAGWTKESRENIFMKVLEKFMLFLKKPAEINKNIFFKDIG